MSDVTVTPGLVIPAAELRESFARSSGPGGQNVNKVASKVELRWEPAASAAVAGLSASRRAWLLDNLADRLTAAGELIVTSSATRDQSRNRDDARDKLAEIVRRALRRPTPRVATRPSRRVRQRRLAAKRRRASVKKMRRDPPSDD